MSLRRLLIWFMLLCTGPLILLAVFLSVFNIIGKIEDRDRLADNILKSFADTIDHDLHARMSALHILTESSLVDDSSQWKDFYREAQGFYKGFGSHVVFADSDLHMLFNTRVPFGSKLPMLPRPKGHSAVSNVLETGKPAVGDIFFGPIAKEPLVAIAAPVQRSGKTTFFLLTIFETRKFQERIDQVPLPPRWSLILLDGNNEVIVSRKPQEGTDTTRQFIVKSSVSPWSTVIGIPSYIYSETFVTTVTALAIALLGIVFVSFLAGTLVSNRLKKSIASLTETAAPGVSPPNITEIASVRRLLDEAEEKRKRSEMELQESEERYRSFFHNSIDAVLLTATDGRIFEANPEACRIFGRSADELRRIGREGVVDANDSRWSPAVAELELTGRFKGELNLIRKDGISFPAELSSATFTDQNGNIRTSMIIRDLTEHNQVKKALEESEKNYRLIAENASDWIYLVSEDGTLRYASPSCERVTGYSVAEFIKNRQLLIEIIHPEDKDIIRQHAERIKEKDNENDYLEFRIITKTGELRWISHTCNSINTQDGLYAGRLGTNRNITERKQAEEELRKYKDHLEELIVERTTELEKANLRLLELDQLKSMFIASMSHELRTPLNSIIGFTGIILMGMSGPLSDVQRKQLSMVKNSAGHLLDLINDVIDVSKIEAGKTDLIIETFDLYPLIMEIGESFTVIASAKGLKLEFQASDGITLESDRRRVKQILVNLISNAIKFTEKGKVSVNVMTASKPPSEDEMASMEPISPAVANDNIKIAVRDTGVGITQKDLEKLFKAFNRIYIQGRPVVEGTGLGLYLSRKIAILLGGEITAKSEPDKGSEFILYLPWKYPGGTNNEKDISHRR